MTVFGTSEEFRWVYNRIDLVRLGGLPNESPLCRCQVYTRLANTYVKVFFKYINIIEIIIFLLLLLIIYIIYIYIYLIVLRYFMDCMQCIHLLCMSECVYIL